MKSSSVIKWLETDKGLKWKTKLLAYADEFSGNPSLCRKMLEFGILLKFPPLDGEALKTIVDAIIEESRKPEERS